MGILIRRAASIGGFEVYRVVEPLNIGGTSVGFSGPEVRLGQGVRLWASREAILAFHTVSPACRPFACLAGRYPALRFTPSGSADAVIRTYSTCSTRYGACT